MAGNILRIGMATLAAALTLAARAQTTVSEYVLTRSDEVIDVTWATECRDDSIFLTIDYGPQWSEQKILPDMSNKSWHLINVSKGIDYTVILENGVYRIDGTLKGKPVHKALKSKGYKWYQSIAFSGWKVLPEKGVRFNYESIRPDSAELYVMESTITGEATVNGRPAKEIKTTAAGFLSAFWSCLYYIDAVNGQFLQYKGVEGLPGTPITVWTLKE